MSAYLDISHAACRHCAAGIPFSQGRPKLYHWQSGMFSSVECTAPTKDAVIEQQASEIAGLRKAVKRAEEAEQRTDARYTQLMAIENSISGGAYEGGPVGEYIEAVTKLRTERDFATHRLSLSLGIVEELRTALNRLSKLLAVCKVRSPATKSILNGNIEAAGAALALTAPDSLHMEEVATLKAKLAEAEKDRARLNESVEFREPVKPVTVKGDPVDLYQCPCGERVKSWNKFCPNCGSRIKWTN